MEDVEARLGDARALAECGRAEEAYARYRALADELEDRLASLPAAARAPVRVLLLQSLANASAMAAQMRLWPDVETCTSRALSLARRVDPSDATSLTRLAKARLRRAMARVELERFADALQDLDEALLLDQAVLLGPALAKVGAETRVRARDLLRHAASAPAPHTPSRMAETHTLRLNLTEPLVTTKGFGESPRWTRVHLALSNEFGLFAADPTAAERAHVRIRVLPWDPERGVGRNHEAMTAVRVWVRPEHEVEEEGVCVRADDDTDATRLDAHGRAAFELVLRKETRDEVGEPEDRPLSCMLEFSVEGFSAPVIPVVSTPLGPAAHGSWTGHAARRVDLGRARAPSDRDVERRSDGAENPGVLNPWLVVEAPGSLGIGGKVWDAGLVLAAHLRRHPALLRGETCLELGSGTGVVGVVAASLRASERRDKGIEAGSGTEAGAGSVSGSGSGRSAVDTDGGKRCDLEAGDFLARHVTLTDLPEVVPLLRDSCRINGEQGGEHARLSVAPLPWGSAEALARLPRPAHSYSLVLLADVVYDPAGYDPLLATLAALARARSTAHPGATPLRLLLAYRPRHPEARRFFEPFRRCVRATLQHGVDRVGLVSRHDFTGGGGERDSRGLRADEPEDDEDDVAIYHCEWVGEEGVGDDP